MGKLEARQRLTVVRRLCGHDAMGPNGVLVQSMDRIRLPIAPPPTSQSSGLVSSGAADAPGANCWRDMRSFPLPGPISARTVLPSVKILGNELDGKHDTKKCS